MLRSPPSTHHSIVNSIFPHLNFYCVRLCSTSVNPLVASPLPRNFFHRLSKSKKLAHKSTVYCSMEKKDLLVYGATGHTGKLISQTFHDRGISVTLAGRNESKLKELSEKHSMPYLTFDLNEEEKLNAAVGQHKTVLNVAGPFTSTYLPVIESCIKNNSNYLDVTGELNVIENLYAYDKIAKEKNIMIMPAIGFDAVPGDCLAKYLHQKLPTATHLDLATFIIRNSDTKSSPSYPSHGTMLSAALHIFPNGGKRKVKGNFVREAIGNCNKTFEVGDGGDSVPSFSFPAAELFCSSHSTAIPNITTYFPGKSSLPFRTFEMLGPQIVNSFFVKPVIQFLVNRIPEPKEANSTARMVVTAEVRDEKNNQVKKASLSVGPGYIFTAKAACEISKRVIEGKFSPGFQSPASVYGSNLVLEIPNESVSLIDIP